MNTQEKITGKLAFRPEEVADGKLTRFVNILMETDAEIRLWTDGFCWIVEYIENIDAENGTHFIAADGDEVAEMLVNRDKENNQQTESA